VHLERTCQDLRPDRVIEECATLWLNARLHAYLARFSSRDALKKLGPMISAQPRNAKPGPRLGLTPEKGDEIIGIALSACVVLVLASLASYHPLDPSVMHRSIGASNEVKNFIGPFGAQLSSLAFSILGVAAFLLPLFLMVAAVRRLTHAETREGFGRIVGCLALLALLPALLQLLVGKVAWRGEVIDAGGTVGVVIQEILVTQLHWVGAVIVLTVCLLIAGTLATRSTLADLLKSFGGRGAEALQQMHLRRAQQQKRDEVESRKERVIKLIQQESSERERRDAAVAATHPATTPRVEARLPGAPPSAGKNQDLSMRIVERQGESRFSVRKVTQSELLAREGHIETPVDTTTVNVPLLPNVSIAHGPGLPALPLDRQGLDSSPAERRPVDPAPFKIPPLPKKPPTLPWNHAQDLEIEGHEALSIAELEAAAEAVEAQEPLDREPARPAPAPAAREPLTRAEMSARSPTLPSRAPLPAPRPTPVQVDLGFDPDELLPELPPVNLLSTDSPESHRDEAELMKLGQKIHQSTANFGVEGEVEAITPGPVITVFEFKPAPGVKVSKVVNLQDDLALALRAESVRIDRMPGRSTLGIEVPNAKRSVIPLGRLLADERFKKSPSVLTMALGVDIHGQPCYFDLATMPHLLVAGATGSGKSVGLQSMITSILYKATRDEVQFIFIDPKRIELGVYADIPHLKTEVVVEPKKAANALRWAVAEMERRYRLLAEVHVRSIDYYNRAIKDPRERERLSLKDGPSEFKPEDFAPLPYYVIIIDELADLMMVASSDVEASIARLAQMARAVGIHLIVATQRPSVDVLTGTIKANFPCRLAFATASRHDSRTILDQIGSEKLLGKGDALFMPPGSSRIMRLHGAYISEQETAGLIRWLKKRGKPSYDPNVVKAPEGESEGGGSHSSGPADDELFEEAARLVVAERQASASFLQRRMRVGFSRAARLIDLLESEGFLGPPQGSKPREVLVPVDYFSEIDSSRVE
jgi:DNA segregation ATPase FtsK/SpoIIIE, S-DNA-T family